MDKRKIILALLRIPSNIDNITSGGCGHYTLKLSKFLKEHNIDHEIVYIDQCPINKESLKRNIVVPMHVAVRIGRKYFDGTGNCCPRWWGRNRVVVSVDALKASLRHRHLWNRSFTANEKLGIRRINKHFKELRKCIQ